MGLSYTSSVFFGTFVPRDSKIGKRLNKYIEKHDGQTRSPKVEIGLCGAINGSPQFATIQIADVELRVRRDDPIGPPRRLPDADGWAEQIGLFLAEEGIAPASVAPIGWYFEGSVW